MTKWFDTNYHYLVPELAAGQRFSYASGRLVAELGEAQAFGVDGRPVVLGPVTFLRLSKRDDGGDPLDLLDAVLPVYEALLADLVAAGATAVQIDEPLLAVDLDAPAVAAYGRAYPCLRAAAPDVELARGHLFRPARRQRGRRARVAGRRAARRPGPGAQAARRSGRAGAGELGALARAGRRPQHLAVRPRVPHPGRLAGPCAGSGPSGCRWHRRAPCCTCPSTSKARPTDRSTPS